MVFYVTLSVRSPFISTNQQTNDLPSSGGQQPMHSLPKATIARQMCAQVWKVTSTLRLHAHQRSRGWMLLGGEVPLAPCDLTSLHPLSPQSVTTTEPQPTSIYQALRLHGSLTLAEHWSSSLAFGARSTSRPEWVLVLVAPNRSSPSATTTTPLVRAPLRAHCPK